jgi:hypothetical protein
MFDRDSWWLPLKQHAEQSDIDLPRKATWRLLFQVELGLYLLEHLDLYDEPVTVLWIVLSGLPIEHQRLPRYGTNGYVPVATARALLPFAGRLAWENALYDYAKLPVDARAYDISIEREESLDRQLVATARSSRRFPYRFDTYAHTLHQPPSDRHLDRVYAEAGEYEFDAYTRGDGTDIVRAKVHFTLTSSTIERAQCQDYPAFSDRERQRAAITIPFAELRTTSEELDKRLQSLKRDVEWVDRFTQYIHYRTVHEQRLVQTSHLVIDGVNHSAGMVGSGKSTLMKLIAAHTVLFQPTRRITLIVGTTMDALALAHELNTLLAPDVNTPLAVPILGHSTRDDHLRRFYTSAIEHDEHWGQRWLATICPLQGEIQPNEMDTSLLPGREPCESLYVKDKPGERRVCPLFYACPAQQTFHDLPSAPIWITTPGGLNASVPFQRDSRRPKLSYLVYEQSDLVIFDEADVVLGWFDDQYANQLQLWGTSASIFNRVDPITSQMVAGLERALSRGEDRWTTAQRRTTDAILNLLRQLSSEGDYEALRQWIESGSFTAFLLFARLARLLAGISDPETPKDDPRFSHMLQIRETYFDAMIEGDPLEIARPPSGQDDFAYRLAQIMSRILDARIETILSECEQWIEDVVATVTQRRVDDLLDIFSAGPPQRKRRWVTETKRTLAHKLTFALAVALLDRNLRIVFFEWYNQPHEVSEAIGIQPYRPETLPFADVLPLPATGRIFGTYVQQTGAENGKSDSLARFEYGSIGRWLLLHFHELLGHLGRPGPNVLLLSGTSWLPGSTRWHVDIPISGLLNANPVNVEMIREKSTFTFLPQFETDSGTRAPIYISGSEDPPLDLRRMARSLRRDLRDALRSLEERARTDDSWKHRDRLLILVNSYDQAALFADELARYWDIHRRDEILFVRRNTAGEDVATYSNPSSIQRSEIEDAGASTARILVAPVGAIGRGYNILDPRTNKAAFGAIYFLIRPMPVPYDVQAVAAELNARTLQWCSEARSAVWHHARLHETGIALRQHAKAYLSRAELRQGYRTLYREPLAYRDHAVTTFGKIVQACGRVLRGGVPYDAFFVDAAWAPVTAEAMAVGDTTHETPETSLLVGVVREMSRLVDEGGELGKALYEPFDALLETRNLQPTWDDKDH